MKKRYVFLSLVLVVALLCSLAFTNSAVTNKNVYASGVSKSHGQHIIVVGKGEVETEPDTVKVSFGLKCRDKSLQEGQAKIRENISTVINKIKETNKNAEVYTNYLSSYPVFENGLLAYEFDCCLIAKSSDVNNQDALVDAIVEAGATNIHSTSFLLTNKEDAYIKALVKAKENAESKVKAIYENASLIGLKEETSYNYCEGSYGEKIKITAKVNAFYEVPKDSLNNSENEELKVAETSTLTSENKEKLESKNALNKVANQNNTSIQKAFETSKNVVQANNLASKESNLVSKNAKDSNKSSINTSLENEEVTNNKQKNNQTEVASENNSSIENKNTNLSKSAEENKITSEQVNVSDNNAEISKDTSTQKKDKQSEDVLLKSENQKPLKSTEIVNSNQNKNLEEKNITATKTNKSTKQNAETRKIIDADGNVVVELF